MEKYDYDVIIIGAGPGGLAAAYQLSATHKVLVVEKHLWGGTCPNYGCDPKKMLYGIVETQRQAQKYKHNGLEDTAHLKVNWHDMMQFKRSYTNQIPGGTENGLTNADIDHIAGTCHFLNAHQIQVNERQISAQYFIIATGAEASIPDIEGSNWLKTSTDFLDEDSLPAKIAFIGGGYVAIELANIAVSAGAEVHIFQHNSRVLRNFPEEYTQKLVSLLTEKGIIFHFNDTITAVKKGAHTFQVTSQHQQSLSVDAVYAATGRHASVGSLSLENTTAAYTSKGISVNDHLQTDSPNIFAVGDVIDKKIPKLTPVASFEGRYVAQQIKKISASIQYPVVPHTVFSGPELSQVGVSLETAEQHPELFKINSASVGKWYTYNRLLDTDAQVTVILNQQDQTVAGAVVLATNAEELINYFTLMIKNKTTVNDLKNFIPVYPSVASDLTYYM